MPWTNCAGLASNGGNEGGRDPRASKNGIERWVLRNIGTVWENFRELALGGFVLPLAGCYKVDIFHC